ncbi:hypothetical protein BT67DRAFT_138792 [Trichocladium antarcticum]|uniref:Uncharacterized protein n=1 Tax=Trichocladium antarcticum TaxID=1450529 RepID=A0AAN6UFP8_9PEZI|nr:hypothetical protein BT67DRAFT_138792 [Trichocladium antarcticum]
MGTRHLICVFWKGRWFLAQYGQFDGYPEVQGVRVFKFLSVAQNIANLKAGLEAHVYEPTQQDLDAISAECDAWDANRRAQAQGQVSFERNMTGLQQLYPSLSRETSAGILGIVARASQAREEEEDDDDAAEGGAGKGDRKIPVCLQLGFATDTLFCEWVYVIDLDREVLEVFGGGETSHAGHRFADVEPNTGEVPAFVCSYTFSELYLLKGGDEFLAKVQEALAKNRAAQDDGEEGKDGGPTVACEGEDGEGKDEGEDDVQVGSR